MSPSLRSSGGRKGAVGKVAADELGRSESLLVASRKRKASELDLVPTETRRSKDSSEKKSAGHEVAEQGPVCKKFLITSKDGNHSMARASSSPAPPAPTFTNLSAASNYGAHCSISSQTHSSPPSAITEHKDNNNVTKQRESVEESERRVLRPRRPAQPTDLLQSRFMKMDVTEENARSIIGRHIKVWWPLDSSWYGGVVRSYNRVKRTHRIDYDDGDLEFLDLKKERFLIGVRPGEVLGRPQDPENKREVCASVGSTRDLRKRKTDADKVSVASNNPMTQGDSLKRIENSGQAIDQSNDRGAYAVLEGSNVRNYCNGSLVQSQSESNMIMDANCSSDDFQTCKIINVYERRRHFFKNGKVHGIKLSCVKSDVGLPVFESTPPNPVPNTFSLSKDLHWGTEDSAISLQEDSRPVRPSEDMMSSHRMLAGEMNGRIETGAIQMSCRYHFYHEMQYPERPGRCIPLSRIFIQKIHLDVNELSNVVLDFFQKEVNYAHLNLSEKKVRSVASRVRASTLVAKHSVFTQPATVQGFSGSGLYSSLLKWKQSLQFDDFIMMAERESEEIKQRSFDGVLTQWPDSGPNAEVCYMFFCNNGCWPLGSKSSCTCLFMDLNSSLDFAKGFFCDEKRCVVALITKTDCLQFEFSGKSDRVTVVKVMSGGSDCLGNTLETFKAAVDMHINSCCGIDKTHSALVCQKMDATDAALCQLVLMEDSTRKSISRKYEHYLEKNCHGKVKDTVALKFTAHEASNLSVQDALRLLVGKNGFHLDLSQIVSIFIARNAAFILETSHVLFRIHADRGLVKVGRPSDYILRAEETSSTLNAQIQSMKVSHKKRRRKHETMQKNSNCCFVGGLVEYCTHANGSADCQGCRKHNKRRKRDRQKPNGAIVTANLPTLSNSVEEQSHGSRASSIVEKTYHITAVTRPNGSKLLRLSPSLEVLNPSCSSASEERKSVTSKQSDSFLDFGSSNAMLDHALSISRGEKKQLTAETPKTFYFQQNKHGAMTKVSGCSMNTSSSRNGIWEKNAVDAQIGGKGQCLTPKSGNDVDQFLQGQKHCTQKPCLGESEHDVTEELVTSEFLTYGSTGGEGDSAVHNVRYQDFESHSLSCTANILFVLGDRGWRESGARVELLLLDNTWLLGIHERSLTHKAQQSVPSGSINRFTYAMMWKGGKDWSLEFEDRRQWFLFKEIHQECFKRNIKAASVRNIPIPGVYLVKESPTRSCNHPFVRPEHSYIYQSHGEEEASLNCSRALYDIDSEDEEWLAEREKKSDMVGMSSPKISDDTFGMIIEKLEKTAYINHHDMLDMDVVLEICEGLGPSATIEAVYSYWAGKRNRKGMPLVRYFQPAPWERYERQLQEWEAGLKRARQDSNLSSNSSSAHLERPSWFAFCLRPKGLDVPNKVQKQRSQRKLGSTHKSKSWSSATMSNLATNFGGQVDRRPSDEQPEELYNAGLKHSNFPLGEDHDNGARVWDFKRSLMAKGRKVRPGNETGSFDIPICDSFMKIWQRTPSPGEQRWNAKRLGIKRRKRENFSTILFSKGKRKSGKQARRLQILKYPKREKDINVGLPPVGALSSPSRCTPHDSSLTKTRNGEPVALISDLDLERVASAKAAVARKAVHVAVGKRAKAEALYAVADAAMHKAVSAVIAAEAFEKDRVTRASTSEKKLSNSHSKKGPVFSTGLGGKQISDPVEDLVAGCFVPKQEVLRKTVKSNIKMLSRDGSAREDFAINTEDALLPIASWSRELGAGIGTRLVHPGEMSPQRNQRHPSTRSTVSECAS